MKTALRSFTGVLGAAIFIVALTHLFSGGPDFGETPIRAVMFGVVIGAFLIIAALAGRFRPFAEADDAHKIARGTLDKAEKRRFKRETEPGILAETDTSISLRQEARAERVLKASKKPEV